MNSIRGMQAVCTPSVHSSKGTAFFTASRCNTLPRPRVAVHGILDSYRREKGLPVPTEQNSSASTGTSSSSNGLIERASQGLSKGAAVEDAGDSPCFVECVTQVYTVEEMQQALQEAGPDALVVVDFYKTACGACKYIQPGFVKLCKAAAKSRDGVDAPPIVFVKHNVYDDEEEEVTDLAKKYNVRSVPRFLFFKDGEQVDNFATRDRHKVAEAILLHAPEGIELGDW